MNDHQKASETLGKMRAIVSAERLIRGSYATTGEESESFCEGRKFCAIGSLWFAYGAPVVEKPAPLGRPVHVTMLGIIEEEREMYLALKPALKIAYDALNAAAEEWWQRNPRYEADPELGEPYGSVLENLFESTYDQHGDGIGRDDLLEIIDAAAVRVASDTPA